MATVAQLIEMVSSELAQGGLVFGHGTATAWDEATALVLGVTELADIRANLDVLVSASAETRVRLLLKRRLTEKSPLAYLLGRCKFAGLEFFIEPGVVIPRSPIGELIEQQLKPWLTEPPAMVLDLCTGSGCIGIAAAVAFPEAEVTLLDLDPSAVTLARRNVSHHRFDGRVQVLQGDLFDALSGAEQFDLILTNPPYVDQADMASLPAEFRFEPSLGLDGGRDGLDLVRRIITDSTGFLSADGLLVCEVGMSAAALQRAYPRLPFLWPEFERGGEGVFLLSASDLRAL